MKRKMFLLLIIIYAVFLSALNAAVSEPAAAAVTRTAKAVLYGKITVLGGREAAVDAVIEAAGNSEAVKFYGDKNGFYRLELSEGRWELLFTALGLETKKYIVEVEAAETDVMDVFLDRIDFVSDAIIVSAKKDKTEVIKTSISREEIKKIPGTAGDALRAVQSLPGVAMTGDFSSGLVVQGGGPGDNLYLLDSMPWPYPFHFGGILSTIYSGLISTVDLYSAGFGVLWGNSYGAVLDVKTRPAEKEMFKASADVSLITMQALLEAPIGIGDASVAIYGRRSYIDLVFGGMLSSGGFTAVPFFWDIGGSVDFSLGKENRFRGIILATDDMLTVLSDDETDTTNAFSGGFSSENGAISGGLSWINTSLPGVMSRVTAYCYDLIQKQHVGKDFNIDIGQSDFGLKWEAEWKAGELLGMTHAPAFGAVMEVIHNRAAVFLAYDIVHNTADPVTLHLDGSHINRGGYIQDSVQIIKGLDFTAGLRYDKNDNVKRDTFLPRVSAAWQSDSETLWKAAWGMYSQFPDDIQLNDTFGNPRLQPSMAQHAVAGVERKITAEISARLNAYYKYYTGLIANTDGPDMYDNSGLGMAKGVELFLNAKFGKKFFGWISYAFSKSERMSRDYNKWVLYRYDQTNLMTAVASYNFTPAWSAGFKLHYNSGPLVKKLESAYQDINGDWHGVFSDEYEKRLEDYLRMDIRTDYTFRFEGWKLNLYLEILNLFNRSNPSQIMYSEDYSESRVINNLPLMPYIGVEAEF
jgi:outer membrane receptor protein involved in Fe transport